MAEADRRDGDEDDAALGARRRALAERLEARLGPPGARPPARPGERGAGLKGAADGMKLASEFVAGVLVGAGLGYLFDRILGTRPFGLVVFLILGFVAGVLNVLRSVGPGTSSGSAPAGDERAGDERGK